MIRQARDLSRGDACDFTAGQGDSSAQQSLEFIIDTMLAC